MSHPTTVILGAGGMLASCWTDALRGADVRALSQDECDILDPAHVRAALTRDVGIVINAAAYTEVDAAEVDENAATAVNAEAVARLAERCRAIDATLVHYSTDYVFPGTAFEPIPTDAPRDPVNAYGRSKAEGERRLEDSGADFLLLRTSWLYAPHGRNFVRTLVSLARERDYLRVVSDQIGRPTSAERLVDTTRRLLDVGARGVHHACDQGHCSWFDLATLIASLANPACVVEPCATEEFPRPAPRPAYSVLDLSKTTDLIGPIPHWRESAASVVRRILSANSAAA